MNLLSVSCPKTKKAIPTGLDMSRETFQRVLGGTLRVQCPHCNQKHEISIADAARAGPGQNQKETALSDADVQSLAERMTGTEPRRE